MELLTDVSRLAERNFFDDLTVINLGIDICTALEAAGADKIIYADITPQNIFMSDSGYFKLDDSAYINAGNNNYRLGAASRLYAAPEILHENIPVEFDVRHCIYSLGLVMYRLLNKNKLPFASAETRLSGKDMPELENCGQRLNGIILKACAFEQENRYGRALQMKKELAAVKETLKPALPINEPAEEIKAEPPEESANNAGGENNSPFNFDFRTGVILGLKDTKNLIQHLNIPSDIGGRKVKKIGERAFYLCPNLINVSISPSLQLFEIGNEAFSSCENLRSIEIPSSASLSVSIGDMAFKDCVNLNSARISNKVIFIGEGAFENCFNMTVICPKDSAIHKYCSGMNAKARVIFDSPEILTRKVARLLAVDSGILNIPAEYTCIEKSAFVKRRDVKNISIPPTVENIGDFAFEKCVNLEYISIPPSVTYIGKSAFLGCTKLRTVQIPNNAVKIEDAAFMDCAGLREVTVPASVTSIGKWAFWGCKSLMNIRLSPSVEYIGANAFPYNDGFAVICQKNSYTHEYCVKNNIKIKEISEFFASI